MMRSPTSTWKGAPPIDRSICDGFAPAKEGAPSPAQASPGQTYSVPSEFSIAELTHELKTGLMSVVGYSEMLLQTAPNAPPERDLLGAIHANGRYLVDLLDSLVQLNCNDGRVSPPVASPCRIREMTAEIMASFGAQATFKGLSFECHCSAELPEQIQIDAIMLRRILVNLVSNSIKYSSQGTVSLSIFVGDGQTDEADRTIVFEVKDAGTGIAPEELARLGTPFFRGSAGVEAQVPGSGLGLFITKRLVETLGGCLSVSSRVGQGSRFTVSCPLIEVAVTDDRAQPSASTKPEQSNVGGRILLVENDPDAQRLVKSFLTRQGLEVDIANDGNQALSLERRCHDLVLLDFHLPGLDGLSIAHRLREQGFRGAIIGLSGAQPPSRRALAKAGIDNFLAKTTSLDRLVAVCHEYLPKRPAAVNGGIRAIRQNPKLRMLRSNYVDRLQHSLEQLREAFALGDSTTAAAISHQIMGTSGLYGMESVARTARTLNESLRTKQPKADVRALVKRLGNQVRRAARTSVRVAPR